VISRINLIWENIGTESIVQSCNKYSCSPNSSNEKEPVKENNKATQRSNVIIMYDIGVDDNMLAEALGNLHVTISNIDDDHKKSRVFW
jgi:hypothetical protein